MAIKPESKADVRYFNLYIPGQTEPQEAFENIRWGDIQLDFFGLQKQLSSFLSIEDEDLLLLALTVAHVDSRVRRSRSSEWRRSIFLRIPVADPQDWMSGSIMTSLKNCLEVLTRDSWQFEFYRRPHDCIIGANSQGSLPFIEADVAMPYSEGLDSRAAWGLMEASKTLAITIRSGPHTKFRVLESNREIVKSWIGVKLCINRKDHPEMSFRTRTFLFFSICALLAKRFRIQKIAVPETGQGAIGSAMISWGNDHSYYGAHPLFTHYLDRFLSEVYREGAPRFSHPYLWMTKSELLRSWLENDGNIELVYDAIKKTNSCSSGNSRFRGIKNGVHCGICPNCFLRRLALISAGMDNIHAKEKYIWRDLYRATLEDMILNQCC